MSLVLALVFLSETLTPLRLIGIALTFIAPGIILRTRKKVSAVGKGAATPGFLPQYLKGYIFAILCTLSFGTIPILIRKALEDVGAAGGIAGGLVSYEAATSWCFCGLANGRTRAISGTSVKWFTVSGVFVGISQMFRYVALATAPVTVVQPLQHTAAVFPIIFG